VEPFAGIGFGPVAELVAVSGAAGSVTILCELVGADAVSDWFWMLLGVMELWYTTTPAATTIRARTNKTTGKATIPAFFCFMTLFIRFL
jgi:hypothetical protein